MRRYILVTAMLAVAAAAIASDSIVRLTGWAEIPHTYRHPGPVSGQFTTPNDGVVPPYQGQPIPGFSGVIPSPTPGRFIALPDNGYGAQNNSADFVLGFYDVTPRFKTSGDGTTSRGPVDVNSHTPFSDPDRLLDATYITGGPVYERTTYYSSSAIPVDASFVTCGCSREPISMSSPSRVWTMARIGWARSSVRTLLHFDAQGHLLRTPVRHPVLARARIPRILRRRPPTCRAGAGSSR